MSAEKTFDVGLDPTPLNTISASQLLQMIEEAKPAGSLALVYVGAIAPDVIENPEYTKYLWFDISAAPYTLKYWTGLGWAAIEVPAGAIDTANIAPGSVTLEKLDASGADGEVLRISLTDPPELEFEAPLNLFEPATIPFSKMVPGTNNYLLRTDNAGVINWFLLDGADIQTRITNGTFAIAKLVPSAVASKILWTNASGVIEWFAAIDTIANDTLPLTKLVPPSPDVENMVPARNNAGATVWKNLNDILGTYNGPALAFATGAVGLTWAHGLANIPKFVHGYIVCHTPDAVTGHAIGDRISILSVQSYDSSATGGVPYIYVDATNVKIVFGAYANLVRHKTTGLLVDLTDADWNVEITARL